MNSANVPTGAWSNWIPSASNTQVFAKGKHEIEWRSTDGSGSSTCNLYVDILDNEAPVALCKAATIFLNSSGEIYLPTAEVNNGTYDNCGMSLSVSPSNFSCANVGPNTVTLTATDASGNSHSCQATVTVVDNLPPTALCKNATVYLDQAGEINLPATAVNNNSTDNCGIALISVSPNSFACANIGANLVTQTVTDVNPTGASGNTSSCNAIVTVLDNLPPNLVCQNISVQLGTNGSASIVPAQVFNAAASSDNCGTINLLSVSPGQFDCSKIGNNIVTLTANDASGNLANCQAIVTVLDFFTNISVQVTPEDCGMGNGTIVVTVDAPGGQIAYSINGGANWQLSGTFNNLPPATYNVVIQAFGSAGCVSQAIPTVVTTIGNAQTWYKDMDGDGYSDGISVQACVSPGAGWFIASQLIAPSGDCNDSDPMQFPGQTWYKDLDNDGFSDGIMVVSCLKPMGYKHATQMTQTWGDCNDNNAAVHPNAVEICNGIDDDCDGQVDEGLADMTYVGNVTFSNQAQVDAWLPCYTVIQGHPTIQNAGVENLQTLVNLRKVTGNVLIRNTGLDSLSWLLELDTIGGNLTIQQNSQLQTLHGLDNLASVGGTLKHFINPDCAECCAIHELLNTPGGIAGAVSITANQTGCNSVVQINNACTGSSPIVAPGSNGDCPDCILRTAKVIYLYPNPASYRVTIDVKGTHGVASKVVIYDQMGRLVYSKEVETGITNFDLPLPESIFIPGQYVVRVIAGTAVLTKLLVIAR